ncbi:major histocompatibility complex class I-related gene protein-like [Pempheris klunzingeri]|uniref:major histocompatibility complex class I-related gene protein-like n=1 Tax=Pempheris klunzingeri TaxID=3127111 RepID=UPI00397FA3DB
MAIHIIQRTNGCEWDDETGDVNAFMQFGYGGEDFIAFDLNTLTWIAPNPQAVITKHRWDAEKAELKHHEIYLTQIFPQWLKKYLGFLKSSLLRTELDFFFLPNNDGSLQASIDLKLSVTPEDWSRYDCVFRLSGVKDDIVTKLDKAVIRTNEGKTESKGC